MRKLKFNNVKFNNKKLISNIKSSFLILLLIGIFAGVTFYGYVQKNNIKKKQQKIQCVKENKMRNYNKIYTYNDILQYIISKDNIEIKKISKEDRKTNKIINMELEYKGNIESFNKFLDSVHKKENFYGIEKIKIDLIQGNNIQGFFICQFYM